jgi:hypothetical protein
MTGGEEEEQYIPPPLAGEVEAEFPVILFPEMVGAELVVQEMPAPDAAEFDDRSLSRIVGEETVQYTPPPDRVALLEAIELPMISAEE